MKEPGLPWVSSFLEVQGYASGLPMQEVPLQHRVIESISCVYVAQEKISNVSTFVIKGCELHSGYKLISRDI